ncbi:hypothetical protein Mycch_5936 (plasmid) [Mycolicibacterium chubuense NBB4]|uniref:Mce associated membrane protein n=1 Tax=Mycolicibacterium chubuense (strain NBB4) TaxID=710421 RepID=I4BTD5_MYCCN|nr:hypothetical protein [Mycolicibacterium chubuense]AFM20542.1 hypothetical protein Mycch_5936 [Mycolicibacterium chubuense NBB4]
MEGDAGASRLTHNVEETVESTGRDSSTHDTPADSADAAENPPCGLRVDENDSAAPATATVNFETGRPDEPEQAGSEGGSPASGGSGRRRLSPKWSAVIAAVLALVGAATAVGGYLAQRAHQDNESVARANRAAITAAEACIAATQPADAAALAASQRTLDECTTGDFETQAMYYSAVLSEAYQAVNVRVQIPEMHAAVERNNDDGSIVALVAFRAKVSQNGVADRENSYRVRVKLVPESGRYKIAKLDQVAK